MLLHSNRKLAGLNPISIRFSSGAQLCYGAPSDALGKLVTVWWRLSEWACPLESELNLALGQPKDW